MSDTLWFHHLLRIFLYLLGFLQKEIEKAEIPTVDTGENPDAPHAREMIDLEVVIFHSVWYLAFHFRYSLLSRACCKVLVVIFKLK